MNTFSRVAMVIVGMTGLAAAQPKADTKAADPKTAPKAPDAKTPPKADAGAMPEMKPPTEIADMAKAAGGTWHCKGQGMDHSMKMQDMTATMKMKVAMNGWWIQGDFESRMGKEPFQFTSFTTFDPASKKWKRVMVESGGGWSTGESAGLKDGKVEWDLTAHSMMGEMPFRDHEDMTDAKAGAKFWGEFSSDKGKTWTKVYEMTCKK